MNLTYKVFFYSLLVILSQSILAVNDSAVLSKDFPSKLSEFNFFSNQAQQIPSNRVIPYDLISTLFSDYSYKKRFVYVPEGKKATYREDWVFDFPVGSALVKTFYYPLDERDLTLGNNLLETRLFLHKENGWDAVSYAWNVDQTEAYLKIAGKTVHTSWINKEGRNILVRYRVPNKNQCKECHSTNDEISPIGPKARNLNREFNYSHGSKHQLVNLLKEGVIESYPNTFRTIVDWEDNSFSLEERARAYLAINCGHCHMTSGVANSTGLYLNLNEIRSTHLGIYKSPVATGRGSGNLKYSIVPGQARESILLFRMISTDPGVMMPESGRSLVHKEAVLLIEEWINSMK